MAMLRRPRPAGGRHPPPLAPTVSNFKPRAQWTYSGSSVFLYVNLPGFYMDQIKIIKDEKTRTVQIQGQRPLSTQTKASFNETYRVPESCDMTNLDSSFSHGLLTIEFPAVVKGEKPEKEVQDKGKTLPNQEKSRGASVNESILGRKKPSDMEKQVGTSQEKALLMADEEEPKTYKSVVEGKRAVPTEQKVKEGETSPSLGRKEHAKEEKVNGRKVAARLGQQKLEEEARSTPTALGSLKPKVPTKEEKVSEIKKDADIIQNKTGQKVKEEVITRTPTIGGSLEPKVNAKPENLVERKGDGDGKKLIEEGKVNLGQKKQVTIAGYETRNTEKKIAETKKAEAELKTKEKAKVARDVNGNVKSKQDEKNEKMFVDNESEKETGLAKEPGNVKVDSEMKEPTGFESETGSLVTKVDSPALKMNEEESQKYDIPLVNVGVAALVIMGFGAYVFIPLIKLLS